MHKVVVFLFLLLAPTVFCEVFPRISKAREADALIILVGHELSGYRELTPLEQVMNKTDARLNRALKFNEQITQKELRDLNTLVEDDLAKKSSILKPGDPSFEQIQVMVAKRQQLLGSNSDEESLDSDQSGRVEGSIRIRVNRLTEKHENVHIIVPFSRFGVFRSLDFLTTQGTSAQITV